METETTAWSEFLNWGEAIIEQILVSEERNIQNSRTLRVTDMDLSR